MPEVDRSRPLELAKIPWGYVRPHHDCHWLVEMVASMPRSRFSWREAKRYEIERWGSGNKMIRAKTYHLDWYKPPVNWVADCLEPNGPWRTGLSHAFPLQKSFWVVIQLKRHSFKLLSPCKGYNNTQMACESGYLDNGEGQCCSQIIHWLQSMRDRFQSSDETSSPSHSTLHDVC